MKRLLAATVLLAAVGAVPAAPSVLVEEVRVRMGDDPAWSAPDLDDAGWQTMSLHDVPGGESVVWMRARVFLPAENFVEGEHLGVYYAALAAHEIYWDGELLGRGGVVGESAAREIPGPVQARYLVPGHAATPGEHVIALRTSSFHRHFEPVTGHWTLAVGDYQWFARIEPIHARYALASLSGLVLFGLFALLMFFQDTRDLSFLSLGFLCVFAVLLLGTESFRSIVDYPYNYHLLRLVLVTTFAWLLQVSLVLFLAQRFPMRGAALFAAAGALLAGIPVMTNQAWDPKVIGGLLMVLPLGLGWTVLAAARKRPGALPAALGLGISVAVMFWQPARFADRHLFPALNLFLAFLLVQHVTQVRRTRRERESALLKSARLENELLKKYIQPHFLLNTLTALGHWIEQQPEVATRMIQALSDEFRMLSSIAHRRLITMHEELELCRTHLEIMSRRKGCDYRLTSDGVDGEASVPPAIIHTLVENAITHNHYPPGEVAFVLSETRQSGSRRYRFTAPMAPEEPGGGDAEGPAMEPGRGAPRRPGPGAPAASGGPPPLDGPGRQTHLGPPGGPASLGGTGLRYIRSRLEESFGSGWRIENYRQGSVWCTEIVLPAEGGA